MSELRFRLRPRLRSPRRELVCSEYGLLERFWFGLSRYTPWRRIRDVRWLAGGDALIEREDARPIRLRRGRSDLSELVAQLQAHVLADRQRSGQRGIDQVLVSEWLATIATGRSPGAWRRLGLAATVCGALLGVLCLVGWLPEAVGMAGAVVLVVGGLTYEAAFAAGYRLRLYDADTEGLHCASTEGRLWLPWQAVVQVTREPAQRLTRQVRLAVATTGGRHVLLVPVRQAKALEGLLRRVAEFNTAHLAVAGERLISGRALSLARGDRADADRGLSQPPREEADA